MKYSILPLIFILFSCTLSEPDDTIITNHSTDKIVTVKFLHTDIVLLNPGQSLSIKTIKTVNPSKSVEYYSPNKKVSYIYTNPSLKFDFYDRDSYAVKIFNLTGKAGILSADGWMDDINFSDTISEQINMKWLLYISNPKFSAVTDDGFPLSVLFLKNDNVISVTIN